MWSLDQSVLVLWTLVLPDPADDYVRVVGVVGKQYQVHWLYTPDSYDTLLSTSELRGAQLDKLPLVPPYHVSSRWVEDTPSFNEWMNEKDYEVISKDGQLVPTAPYLGGWTEPLVHGSTCFVVLLLFLFHSLFVVVVVVVYVYGARSILFTEDCGFWFVCQSPCIILWYLFICVCNTPPPPDIGNSKYPWLRIEVSSPSVSSVSTHAHANADTHTGTGTPAHTHRHTSTHTLAHAPHSMQ